MKADKQLAAGSTTLLILSLLAGKDMYGYELMEALSQKSNNAFTLKAGTLYPLLHTLCQQEVLYAYEQLADNARQRKYYRLTAKGKKLLEQKEQEWDYFQIAVNNVLKGGLNNA